MVLRQRRGLKNNIKEAVANAKFFIGRVLIALINNAKGTVILEGPECSPGKIFGNYDTLNNKHFLAF